MNFFMFWCQIFFTVRVFCLGLTQIDEASIIFRFMLTSNFRSLPHSVFQTSYGKKRKVNIAINSLKNKNSFKKFHFETSLAKGTVI